MTYPSVLSEMQTLDLVVAGRSLARYGDGEFKLCAGGGIKCQKFFQALSERLRAILKESGDCLVGIPNIWSSTPKIGYWQKYAHLAAPFLAARQYVSAFITRPDSAPWINQPEFWAKLESLWKDRDVTLVRGTARSLTAEDLVGAKSVREIVSSRNHAWSQHDELLEQIGTPERVLLCLGPTATVLAVDLAVCGVHAIDLGHIGMFLRKHLAGQPMIRTDADKVSE